LVLGNEEHHTFHCDFDVEGLGWGSLLLLGGSSRMIGAIEEIILCIVVEADIPKQTFHNKAKIVMGNSHEKWRQCTGNPYLRLIPLPIFFHVVLSILRDITAE
jgi:hypothetical protein